MIKKLVRKFLSNVKNIFKEQANIAQSGLPATIHPPLTRVAGKISSCLEMFLIMSTTLASQLEASWVQQVKCVVTTPVTVGFSLLAELLIQLCRILGGHMLRGNTKKVGHMVGH